MKKYMKEYIEDIDRIISKNKCDDIDCVISNHLVKIGFFQHERLVHFLVTMLFAILFLITFLYFLLNFSFGMMFLCLILFCLLVPYIFHYYSLENGVQYMYRQYDSLLKIKRNEGKKR